MAKHRFLKPGRRVRVPTSAPGRDCECRISNCESKIQIPNSQFEIRNRVRSGSSNGRAAGLYPASTRSVRDPSSSLGRSIGIASCGLRISNWSKPRFAIRNWRFAILFGPEAHLDEFSTFNRGVVGSTPTRPIIRIGDCRLLIVDCVGETPRGNRQSGIGYVIGPRSSEGGALDR